MSTIVRQILGESNDNKRSRAMVSIDQIEKDTSGLMIAERTTESPFKEGSTGFFPTNEESAA